MWFLLVVAVLVVAALLARGLTRKGPGGSRPGPSAPTPRREAAQEEEEERRRETDPAALARARATVSQDVPDEVLADALQDASPAELARLFAAVPTGVMATAMGGNAASGPQKVGSGDLAQLRGAGDAVDDLEIWDFGKND